MYIVLIIIHIIVCLILIAVILLQAGRGGGLTEMFGGETAQSVLGTHAPVVLKKITEASAIAFLITSLLLGMVTARRGKSLFEAARFPVSPGATQNSTSPMTQPAIPEKATVPAGETAPASEEGQPASES
ncbi:MAG: preprotein translocase subunit SecG [Candidatus Omnitrophota bacterium]